MRLALKLTCAVLFVTVVILLLAQLKVVFDGLGGGR